MKTKFKSLFFLFQILICFITNAQSTSYTVDDHTHKLSPFKLSFTMLAFDNLGIQYGLLGEGVINDKLGYNFCYRRSLSKYLFVAKKEDVGNQNDIKTSNYFEASIDFFMVDKLKDGARMKVDVGGDLYTTRFFIASVNKRIQNGLHGGILTYNKMYFSSKDTTSDANIYFENEKGKLKTTGTIYGTNSRNISFFAGFVFKKVKKATIHSGGWKYYKHMARRFYMDALVGFTTLHDISINSGTYVAKPVRSSPIGYRIGFEWDQMGVVTGFEIGMRPGVQYLYPFYNYVNLNFSFNLVNGDKRYGMRNKNK